MFIGQYHQKILVFCFASMALILLGCDSPHQKSFKATKEYAHAEDIRKVVLPLFSKYHYEALSQEAIPEKEIPEKIRSLPVFTTLPKDERFFLTAWGGTNNDALIIVVGGGFGHWGMVVCKDENDREFDKDSDYEYWEKGIYFYSGN
jgi:hypothetical protein